MPQTSMKILLVADQFYAANNGMTISARRLPRSSGSTAMRFGCCASGNRNFCLQASGPISEKAVYPDF